MGKPMANPKGPPLFLYYLDNNIMEWVGRQKIMSGIDYCKGGSKHDDGGMAN